MTDEMDFFSSVQGQNSFFCITKKEVKIQNISGLCATSTGVLLDTAGSHRTLTR